VIDTLRETYQGLAALRGRPVVSADGKEVGQVVEVDKSPDDKIHSIETYLGRWLGLGSKVVRIEFEHLADQVRLRLSREEVQSMPDATQKPAGK
jgi:sporulation protein YlmC with PRC-barrel domain